MYVEVCVFVCVCVCDMRVASHYITTIIYYHVQCIGKYRHVIGPFQLTNINLSLSRNSFAFATVNT